LPPIRVNTIQQFLQTGKSVYLQGEYDCALSTNQAFASMVNSNGGTFTWGNIGNGILPMNILSTFATTPHAIYNNLPYFNFGCDGSGCGVQYFLERGGKFYGFFFCPPLSGVGRIIQTTDQDWIINNSNDTLMKNVFAHLVDSSLCNVNTFTPTNLGPDTTLCAGSALLLNASNSNATYLCQDGSTGPTFLVTQTGLYWVQVSNNCGVFRDTLQVNYAPAPVIDLGPDTLLCSGQSFLLNAFQPGANYLWQDNSINAVYTVNAAGTYKVRVSIGNCSVVDSIKVTMLDIPSVNLGKDTAICETETLVLNAFSSTASSYLWQDGSVNSSYNVNASGIYIVAVTNACGAVRDSIVVTVKASPLFSLGKDTTLCGSASILLDTGIPNATYLWSTGATTTSITVLNASQYWVRVTVDQCSATDTIIVKVVDFPLVSLGTVRTLCPGETLLLNATWPGASYLWQDQSTQATLLVDKAGLYVVAVSVEGCSSNDSINISYFTQRCDCEMLIPNAFSPNNDGRNDEFKYIVNEEDIELREFLIYNRWGQIAFQAQNKFDQWNGNFRGVAADNGVYYYRIRYLCALTGKEIIRQGDIFLMR
jgi:gliding motility-associated-like protein